MDNVILVCTNCSQQNRVLISSLHIATCGKCRNKLASSSNNNANEANKIVGKIKWFSDEKGFGFIQDDAGSEYFFHIKSVESTLEPQKGSTVTFNSTQGKKGPEATNVFVTQGPVSYEKPAKIFVIGDHRILLNKIKTYSVHEKQISYRNSIKQPTNPFKLIVFDNNQLWSDLEFKYLYIQMFDGSTYYVYSDQVTKRIYAEMYEYFRSHGAILSNNRFNSNELSDRQKKSFAHIGNMLERNFYFVDEDISFIINKLDSAFNAIH